MSYQITNTTTLDRVNSLTTKVLESDPWQAFPYAQHYRELYSLITLDQQNLHQVEKCALECVCNKVKQYACELSSKIDSSTAAPLNLGQLVRQWEHYFYAIQRLDGVCCRLLRRVHSVFYTSGPHRLDDLVNQTAIESFNNEVINNNRGHFVSASKNAFNQLLTSDYSRHPDIVLSKYAQYVLWLDQYNQTKPDSEKSLFRSMLCDPFMQCLSEFGRKYSAQLITPESKPNWHHYLSSVFNQWQTGLRGQLFIAFNFVLENENNFCLPIMTNLDTKVLCQLQYELCEQARLVYFTETVLKNVPTIIKFISEKFIGLIDQDVDVSQETNKPKLIKTDCYGLIKLLYNNLPTMQLKVLHLGALINDLGDRFENVLKSTYEQSQSTKRPAKVIKAEQHLATVKYLSNFEEAINKLMHNYLYNQPQMHEMVKELMKRLVNRAPGHACSNFSKCLTVFMHHNLSSAYATDPEDCTLLEQSLRLFPYLKSKSEFESLYRSYLEKRLLSVNAFWLSKENFVVSYMSAEHDVLYSKQLEKMINDVQVESVKLCDKFVSSTPSLNLQFDLRLNVLNHLAWDKFTQNDDLHLPHKCNQCFPNVANYLPKSFEGVVQKFRKFYLKQYQEPRKLSFCMKQSWAVVEFGVIEEEAPKQHRIQPGSSELKTITNEPKQVKVNLITSAPQLMILMCITEQNSNKPSMTFAELKQKFANILSTEELTRALKLLTHFQVLHKKSTNKDEKSGKLFHDQDVLVFDPRPVAPVNQRSLTNITTMKLGSSIEVMAGHFVGIVNVEKVTKSANETKPVSELSKAELDKHHSVCVQAALVRITKKHRHIRYQSLVEEVQSELRTRYNRTGVPLEFIDAQAKAVINLGTITAQPEQLDTDKRDNLISY